MDSMAVLWGEPDAGYKQESIISDKAVQVLVAVCSMDFADIHADVCMQKRKRTFRSQTNVRQSVHMHRLIPTNKAPVTHFSYWFQGLKIR